MARVQVSKAAVLRGLALTAACRISYGLYSPAYNIVTNDPWNMAGPGTPHPTAITHPHECCCAPPMLFK